MNWRNNGITGHRGNPSQAPENTLPGFQNAITLGVDWLETDVRLSKDGRLMLHHDADTGRSSGIRLFINDTDSSILRKLNMASYFNAAHPLLPLRYATMPFLEEVFELLRGQHDVRLSLQPKDDCVDRIVKTAREMKVTDRIGFNDGCFEKMSRARQLLPDAVIFYDTYGPFLEQQLAEARTQHFNCMVSHRDFITREWVEQVKGAGFEAGAWIVNEVAEMEHLLNLGVYRFYTDLPELLQEVKRKFQRSEPVSPVHSSGYSSSP